MLDRFGHAQRTGLILAGGLGTRLSSMLGDRPKVLAPVNGRPFLFYLLDQLQAAGLHRVVLSTGHLGQQVRQAVGECYGTLEVVYSQESGPLGTAGALRLALPLLDGDPVLVLNGDSYCRMDVGQFLRWQRAQQAENSLVVTHVKDTRRFGRVWLEPGGVIVRFEEKQGALSDRENRTADRPAPAGWINAGIYLLSRRLISSIPSDVAVSLEHEVFPAWVGRGLRAYRVHADFLDIGTPDSYAAAPSFFRDRPPSTRTAQATSGRLVLLDRDGTINVEKEYLSDPEGVELLGNAAEGIRRLRDSGLKVVVVTNQSGIARGYFDEVTLKSIHERLLSLLEAEGARLDGIYVCRHHPDERCPCRKPETGLLQQAAEEFRADLSQAFVIGDKAADIECGRRVGATTLLVRTGYGEEVAAQGGAGADCVVADLGEAADVIAQLVGVEQTGAAMRSAEPE